ncbi:MAG: hypothetical protein IPN33_26760 [Saprospiraceae bacterium]|nr:hypothetical protein [Saprospiraceae bacterium]
MISEIEFAARYTRANVLAITGSNGKTTTTMLTYHLAKTGGIDAVMAGNVGLSFAACVADSHQPDWYVLEVSSFQLDGIRTFRPKGGHVAEYYSRPPRQVRIPVGKLRAVKVPHRDESASRRHLSLQQRRCQYGSIFEK